MYLKTVRISIHIYTYRCIIQRVITNPYKHGAHDETLCLFAKWSVWKFCGEPASRRVGPQSSSLFPEAGRAQRNSSGSNRPSGNLRTWKWTVPYCSCTAAEGHDNLCSDGFVVCWRRASGDMGREIFWCWQLRTPRSAQRYPANVLYGGCVCCAPRRHICSDMGTRASWRWQMRTPTPASERAYLRLYFKKILTCFILLFIVHFHYSLVVWFVQLATCCPAGFCTMCMWTLFQRLCGWNWIQILFQKFWTLSQRFGAVFRKSLDLFWGPFPKAFCSAALFHRHAMA